MKTLRLLALVPIWALTNCMKPFFRAGHPWKRKKLTLAWWEDGATSDAFHMSIALWWSLVCATFAIWLVLSRR